MALFRACFVAGRAGNLRVGRFLCPGSANLYRPASLRLAPNGGGVFPYTDKGIPPWAITKP